jgi:serine/threonine protein kinase
MWALGAMTFEMVQGKAAFNGTSVGQIEQRIRTGSHAAFAPETPPAVRAFVQGCLAASPAHRIDAQAALRHAWLSEGSEGSMGGGERADTPNEGGVHAEPLASKPAYHSRVGTRRRLELGGLALTPHSSRPGTLMASGLANAPAGAFAGRTVV